MPLWDEPGKAPVETKQPPVINTSTVYEGTNASTLPATLEGTPMVGVWYGQLLGTDDLPRQIDLTLDPSLQQYFRVNDYVVMRDGTIDPSVDQQTVITTAEFSVKLFANFPPNVGDHFVAKLPDDRMGIFVVKTAEKSSITKGSSWNVTLAYFRQWSQEYQDNFDLKTVKTYFFDFSKAGTPCAMQAKPKVNTAGQTMARLVNWFYDEYYDLMTRTALYPADQRTYDGELVAFFNVLVGRDLRQGHPMLTEYATPTGQYRHGFKSVWDVIAEGEEYGLERASHRYQFRSSTSFASSFVYSNIFGSAILRVVHPSGEPTMYGGGIEDDGEFYVFSKAFYEDDVIAMSPLERLTRQALRNESVTVASLAEHINALPSRTAVERFYEIPLLIWLLAYADARGL